LKRSEIENKDKSGSRWKIAKRGGKTEGRKNKIAIGPKIIVHIGSAGTSARIFNWWNRDSQQRKYEEKTERNEFKNADGSCHSAPII